jgi:phosphate/sulfate permease
MMLHILFGRSKKLEIENDAANIFAAAVAISWMTKLSLAVSISHSIVGGIIGWNLYSGFAIDLAVLKEIGVGWILTPITAALISFILLFFMQNVFIRSVV